MGWLTPKYPEGAEPAKEPSRREKKAAAEKADRDQARAEGWIVPRNRKQSVLDMLLNGVDGSDPSKPPRR